MYVKVVMIYSYYMYTIDCNNIGIFLIKLSIRWPNYAYVHTKQLCCMYRYRQCWITGFGWKVRWCQLSMQPSITMAHSSTNGGTSDVWMISSLDVWV